jgi:hypothetical protein
MSNPGIADTSFAGVHGIAPLWLGVASFIRHLSFELRHWVARRLVDSRTWLKSLRNPNLMETHVHFAAGWFLVRLGGSR